MNVHYANHARFEPEINQSQLYYWRSSDDWDLEGLGQYQEDLLAAENFDDLHAKLEKILEKFNACFFTDTLYNLGNDANQMTRRRIAFSLPGQNSKNAKKAKMEFSRSRPSKETRPKMLAALKCYTKKSGAISLAAQSYFELLKQNGYRALERISSLNIVDVISISVPAAFNHRRVFCIGLSRNAGEAFKKFLQDLVGAYFLKHRALHYQEMAHFAPKLYPKHKDLECARWLIAGKTISETAAITGDTKANVRFRVNRLKDFFGYGTMIQLLVRIGKDFNVDPYTGDILPNDISMPKAEHVDRIFWDSVGP